MSNAADRKSIRQLEKASKLAEQNRREVLVGIMATIPGREWVWNQLERAHIFATSFSPDPVSMAFAEGERNQGLILLNDLMQSCPEQFILAMRENNERRTQRDSTDRRDPESGAAGELNGSENSGRYAEGLDATSDAAFGEEGRRDN